MNLQDLAPNLNPTTLWVVVGVLLIIAEMISASFFLIFLALGCFLASFASMINVPWAGQVATAIVASIFGAYFLRKPIQKRFLKNLAQITDLGASITLDCSIAPKEEKRVTYQGTTWAAINVGDKKLNPGDNAVIQGIEGNKLKVKI